MDKILTHFKGFCNYYLDNLIVTANKPYFIASTIIVMILLYVYSKRKNSFKGMSWKDGLKFLVPKKVYLHKSAIVGYKFFLIDPIIRFFFFNRAMGIPITAVVFISVQGFLTSWFGEPTYELTLHSDYPILFSVGFTILVVLLKDFGFYWHHYLMHKVPFLWEFHKVHHSAEVLTPLTDWRNHPIDMLSMLYFPSLLLGMSQAILDFAFGSEISFIQILGINAIVYFYYSIAYHFRHMHIWLSFGKRISHVFMSPSQHQLHHSVDTRHYDKNFGSVLSLWDWVFGTLYIAKYHEKLEFGLADGEDKEYSSVWALYSLPFIKNWKAGRIIPSLIFIGVLLFFNIVFYTKFIGQIYAKINGLW